MRPDVGWLDVSRMETHISRKLHTVPRVVENGSRVSAARLRASYATASGYGMEVNQLLKRTRLVKSLSRREAQPQRRDLPPAQVILLRPFPSASGRLLHEHETARCELVFECISRETEVALNHVSIWQRLDVPGA
ncbi:hypothetical protein CLCR_03172 [Cladophialophora carrionii]|uniref:Uncharacterized protein n=1 Tax=Cladophialophora carrionii TaxID=86049 RepID=A0A1C1D2D1_9EURO|nr:hypothetical protein CLCR_03172 [Cladophialophora carrionii]